MRATRNLSLFAAVALALFLMLGMMHGGGLDSQGGHHHRKNGGYHLHRGPLAGQHFGSKSAAEQALRALVAQQRTPEAERREVSKQPASKLPTNYEEFLALRRLLLEKGIITDDELRVALHAVQKEALVNQVP